MTLTHHKTPAPVPTAPSIGLPPDRLSYRIKNRLLGPPLHSEQLEHERLGKPTALAVFASDNLSSSAYATEEILHVLLPAVGVAAFSLVLPITIAMLVVLAFLILSYRQTIAAYPKGASAYLVTKDNFGLLPALVAGVSLLTDYVLTVAVSVAAGTAAIASAVSAIGPHRVAIAAGFIVLIAYMNLRGMKESGKIFAVPTYFFVVNMGVLLIWGVVRMLFGDLPHAEEARGMVEFGAKGDGLLMGAGVYVVLHTFASGGAAVTGVEAISDGVPAFKPPEWKNARTTLVIMGSVLAVMFFGLSSFAAHMHVAPSEDGTPTVLSQVGDLVFGDGALGQFLYYTLQISTMGILILAANTSFADFPRLASFQAADNFLPRQLTKRGHRLVFSNGIIALALAAIVLVIATGAKVERLIPLYAVGVFTSFTLSQASMTRRHWANRSENPKWRTGVAINGFGAFLTTVVLVVIAITKFTHGAWLIIALVPIMVALLLRLAHQYEKEATELEHDIPAAATAPILRRHVVLVLIDRLDLAAARAIQYARTLTPDELHAVHFVVDHQRADELAEAWRRLGLHRIPLELADCPDRRLTHAAVLTVAHQLADGETEVSVLLPDRKYKGLWHRILHDQTAEAIAEAVSVLPHANVTTVPFHFGARAGVDDTLFVDEVLKELAKAPVVSGARGLAEPTRSSDRSSDPEAIGGVLAPGCTPIAETGYRRRVRVTGKVTGLRVQPVAGVPALEATLSDDTGGLSLVFLGRREVAGLAIGKRLVAEGMAGEHQGRLAIINPVYQLVSD